ncbi:MAG: glycosyltransferase [Phycisphaerales bacterium]
MRILMLGWEFPPFISGGLGTACYGLTKALDRQGHEVIFVLPRAVDGSMSSHVELLSPAAAKPVEAAASPASPGETGPKRLKRSVVTFDAGEGPSGVEFRLKGFTNVEFMGIPTESGMASPYPGGEFGMPGVPTTDGRRVISLTELERLRRAGERLTGTYEIVEDEDMAEILAALGSPLAGATQHAAPSSSNSGADYAGDVLSSAREYARLVLRLCRDKDFDVIHAHDWMTYPAGMALGRVTGKPLVAHIHSTEFDRSGEHVNQPVYEIERRGMHAAARVIAVSALTKNIVVRRYGVDASKIRVVYNGVEQEEKFAPLPESEISPKDKIVLFLGRITMQKGPEYFVKAAKRVLDKVENVKFIVAGNGDLARKMIEQAADLGIGHKVLFTGFLRGRDVAKVFRMADCYVMPSVSEPFGIAPLEAMSHDTPVIISKQSGVSEVVSHALKVDFWDTDQMANKIVAVLKYPPLSNTLKEHGRMELRRLTWDGAAEKCCSVYEQAIETIGGRIAPAVPHAG